MSIYKYIYPYILSLFKQGTITSPILQNEKPRNKVVKPNFM